MRIAGFGAPRADTTRMTFNAMTLMCVSDDCGAVFDVFTRGPGHAPECCQFCAGQLQETWFDDRCSGPDEDGDDVQVIVVTAPR